MGDICENFKTNLKVNHIFWRFSPSETYLFVSWSHAKTFQFYVPRFNFVVHSEKTTKIPRMRWLCGVTIRSRIYVKLNFSCIGFHGWNILGDTTNLQKSQAVRPPTLHHINNHSHLLIFVSIGSHYFPTISDFCFLRALSRLSPNNKRALLSDVDIANIKHSPHEGINTRCSCTSSVLLSDWRIKHYFELKRTVLDSILLYWERVYKLMGLSVINFSFFCCGDFLLQHDKILLSPTPKSATNNWITFTTIYIWTHFINTNKFVQLKALITPNEFLYTPLLLHVYYLAEFAFSWRALIKLYHLTWKVSSVYSQSLV